MKILGIEHIGIAVENQKDTASFWGEILKIVHTHTERVESEGVKTKIFDTGKGKIELLNSISEDSPIRKFLEKKGLGIHHVCLEAVQHGLYSAVHSSELISQSYHLFIICRVIIGTT